MAQVYSPVGKKQYEPVVLLVLSLSPLVPDFKGAFTNNGGIPVLTFSWQQFRKSG